MKEKWVRMSFAYHSYLEHNAQKEHEEIIERALAILGQRIEGEDKQLFVSMLNHLLTMPVQECYKYA